MYIVQQHVNKSHTAKTSSHVATRSVHASAGAGPPGRQGLGHGEWPRAHAAHGASAQAVRRACHPLRVLATALATKTSTACTPHDLPRKKLWQFGWNVLTTPALLSAALGRWPRRRAGAAISQLRATNLMLKLPLFFNRNPARLSDRTAVEREKEGRALRHLDKPTERPERPKKRVNQKASWRSA